MQSNQSSNPAFGAPGANPIWAKGAKDGVGTAYSSASSIWFTIQSGIVTEIYYPTIDRPATKDVQFLFSDGETAFDEISLHPTIEPIGDSLGYVVKGEAEGFSYEKEVISDPHLSCLLQRVRIQAKPDLLQKLKVYALCAPRLAGAGSGNNAQIVEFIGGRVLVAEHEGMWLAMGADQPLTKASVGYVGASDGWTDLQQHKSLEWEFDAAPNGNVALVGEVPLSDKREFTLGVAFGLSLHHALTTLAQSLAIDFDTQRETFLEQWGRTNSDVVPLEDQSRDGGALYRTSVKVLLTHEDKFNPGAMIASLAIPWGEAKGDEDGKAGYHLVWTRDMVQTAMGLLAAGKRETPLRAFIFLAASQREDGGFPQNFHVNGDPFWTGLQSDEVAFPILLGHRLWKEKALAHFNGRFLLLRAVRFLVKHGPITQQERWEEASGFSPSTLAVVIAALICAADAARHLGHDDSAEFLERYADWMERNLECWTATKQGTLVPGVESHYVRIAPAHPGDAPPLDGVTDQELDLSSRAPGAQGRFPAKEIVDTGFLELVRYGIRAADDPLIADSVKVVDAVIRTETASGVAWHRYNNDGYGQRDDGSAFQDWGVGRLWPLLTGERGHYEIAAGRDAEQYIRAMENLATATRMIPEQSWNGEDTADGMLKNGRATGSAAPLAWAHAEYIKLLRSSRDKKVYDLIPEVAERYIHNRPQGSIVDFWSFSCPIAQTSAGATLRILAEANFDLRFSLDNWATTEQQESVDTRLAVHYSDVHVPADFKGGCVFTFYWKDAGSWENRNFEVKI